MDEGEGRRIHGQAPWMVARATRSRLNQRRGERRVLKDTKDTAQVLVPANKKGTKAVPRMDTEPPQAMSANLHRWPHR
jgi:hypothetical protein